MLRDNLSDGPSGCSKGLRGVDDVFLQLKFARAFGAQLLNHSGDGDNSEVRSLWWGSVALKGKQYTLPDGGVGTRFVNLLSEEIERCNEGRQRSEREFIFAALVLQRNKMVRKARDIRPLLKRRMDLWEEGKRLELLQEARRCDKQLAQGGLPMTPEHVERVFNRLMLQGKVRSAVRLLTERDCGGVLDPRAEAHGKKGPLGMTVFEVLKEKHPAQRPADPSAFLECDELPLLESVDITAAHIEAVARRLRGSAGPSGTDSEQWRTFLLRYGTASARLREAIASSTRRHANEIVPWDDMRAFLARRGIAIDKQPGVRPIGVGECRQRIEAKAMALATRLDVQEVCGADQLCAGTRAGVEAAVHAMKELFDTEETEGLLLVDAANAFNVLSRPAALWNCRVLWPRCSRFLFNCYRGYAVIIMKGLGGGGQRGEDDLLVLYSREGTTQGCPLAMLEYASAVYPLITRLKDPLRHKQIWYADDSSCAGLLRRIREWLLLLLEIGPSYGYLAEPSKSILVVKEQHFDAAQRLFADLQVTVVLASRFLGGCVGRETEVHEYVRAKVKGWVTGVERLAQAARVYPQSAYAAFTHSLSCEWTYLQRVVSGCDDDYAPLRETIQRVFTPAVLGREVLLREHELFALPAKKGGLALADPVSAAAKAYGVSKSATSVLQEAVLTGERASIAAHDARCRSVTSTWVTEKEADHTRQFERLLDEMPVAQHRTLRRIVKGEASGWLTVLPLRADGYDMSAVQFRDQLAIRYHQSPAGLPAVCDGCGASFSLQHGLDCAKGGLVKKGHNDLRDSDARLAELAWGGVVVEPVLVPENDRSARPMLQADWMVRGVWEGNRVAFFDNRITDADAPSYVRANLSWEAVSNQAVAEKKRKYRLVAEELRGSITPLVCSTDGVLHREYVAYQKRLAGRLATKWQKPFSAVMGWVRVRTQFAIFRAVDLRLRGTRRRIWGLGLQDGAAIGVGH